MNAAAPRYRLTAREALRERIRLRRQRTADDLIDFVAARLPRAVRRRVVVHAAVRFREPDRTAGDRYCGPDGITYADLWQHA